MKFILCTGKLCVIIPIYGETIIKRLEIDNFYARAITTGEDGAACREMLY